MDFWKHRFTELALLNHKEVSLNNFEIRTFTLELFSDFSKAFDTLSHKLLLQKLAYNGIRGTPLSLIAIARSPKAVHIDRAHSLFS